MKITVAERKNLIRLKRVLNYFINQDLFSGTVFPRNKICEATEELLMEQMFNRFGEIVIKLEDPLGEVLNPPLDACSTKYVFEFKECNRNFLDLKQTSSGGGFIDKFKLEQLHLACGYRNGGFRNAFFEEGFYVYIDKLKKIYILSIAQIDQLIINKTAEYRGCFGRSSRDGWMIPPECWDKC